MRASIVASLILLALLGLGLRGWIDEADAPRAEAQETTGRTIGPAEKPPPIWKASIAGGAHTNREEAWDDALRTASRKFADFLQQRYPDVAWTPSPEFIRKHMMKNPKEETTKPETVSDSPVLYVVRLDVELNAENQKEVEKAVREFHVHDRMIFLGRCLGSLFLVLSGIATYIRADEWAKGYLTFPLRIVVVFLVALSIFALWWLV